MLNSQPWEHTQISNFIQTEQAVFMWGKKETMHLKEQGGIYGRIVGRKGKEEIVILDRVRKNNLQIHLE